MSSVLDTNIAIHGLHEELDEALHAQGVLISVITEIELLGFSGMTPSEEADVRALVSILTVIPSNEGIKDETIRLRNGADLFFVSLGSSTRPRRPPPRPRG